jgi:sulfur-oxidizing protein SoxY
MKHPRDQAENHHWRTDMRLTRSMLPRLAAVALAATLAAWTMAEANAASEPVTPTASSGTDVAAEAEQNPIWQKARVSLFQNRPIDMSSPLIRLEAPIRAEDAAVVPIAVRTTMAQTPQRYIRKIHLFIDQNPSPYIGTFEFTPESGIAGIETRVRIEEYTYVRAIAEVSDGSLVGTVRFVKASGGCSAPAGKDAIAARANAGKIKWRVDDLLKNGEPAAVQLMISHPNSSGLVMDQLTRMYESPMFVRTVQVTYAGKPIMTADVNFSISENPNFRFYFLPHGAGELRAEVQDTNSSVFEATKPVSVSTP